MKEITLDEFKKAFKSGANVFAFGAPWCKDCKIAQPMLMQLSEEFSSVGFFGIDVDKNENAREELSIRHIPTILFVKDGIEVCKRLVEPKDINELRDSIKQLL